MPTAKPKEAIPTKKPGFIRSYWWLVFVLLAIVCIAIAIYFYLQYQKTQKLLQSPTLAAQIQTQDLIGKVGKLMELPSEAPTIATVSDASKLKEWSFFQHAKNGDKVLIYTTAKKAILFDPVTSKIVDVGSINLGTTVATTPSLSPTKSVVIPTPSAEKIRFFNKEVEKSQNRLSYILSPRE